RRYAGDYYRGDPSFLSGIGHAIGGIAKVGFGLLTGGPLGAAKAAVNVATAGIQRETLAAGGDQTALTPELVAQHKAALLKGPVGGPASLPTLSAQPPMLPLGPGGGSSRRTHPNRSTYVTRGGGTSHYPVGLQVHPK